MRKPFLKRKLPVLSIDCKKKELIGQFRSPGRTWRQQPIPVLETDFPSDAKGKAVPYGMYDVGYNEGYMVIGVSHETAEFAMNAIQRWWLDVGQARYPGCQHILLQADSGGSVRHHHSRKSLSGWRFQMESHRASYVLHHQPELGRATLGQL